MPRAVEVFTPNDSPTFTYVERSTHQFEKRLREALEIPKMIISLSGPSKSGKTVLVNRVIPSDNLISVSGASIHTAQDLWTKVMAWMEVPNQRVKMKGTKYSAELETKAGEKAGLPLVAEGKAEVGGSMSGERSHDTAETFDLSGLAQVIKEIGESEFVVFVDDFHYIRKDVQQEIGRQIKEAAENGVRICTASVPHRSDDVVRSNTELRGRVQAIDMSYWSGDELEQIAHHGFRELNLDVAIPIIKKIVAEAFGSPQLMQAICLNFCFENNLYEKQDDVKKIEVDFVTLENALERTSTMTDFSSMLSVLHSGPRQRGQERKVFRFTDGSEGDVYRCILLAMKADPPRLSFAYDDMLARTKEVSIDENPVGSSVAQALEQMEKLASAVQEAPVIEWDEDVLDIVEPYFLFFLRCSSRLRKA